MSKDLAGSSTSDRTPKDDPQAAVLYEVAGGVATITLNRPDYRNALSVEIVNGIGDHFEAALADPEVRAILFTHVGNTFCAGADLRAAQPGVPQPTLRHNFVEILEKIMTCDKPVVGRLAGHVTAGGVGLAAAMDISVAADDAIIGFTEVRIGVAPAVISVTLRRLVRGGPNALANTKQLVTKVPSMPRDAAWEWTAELSQRLFQSEEAAEGIAAFRERRDASWVPQGK
ncbi:MAG: enoyl-CoA hydratase-related protein [Acidimicrobiaceae bacterium]|nr:enoyl-CoA hydratase-related protein [Acidimicrobiaceae bacterium]